MITATWYGHATVLLEVDGLRVLTDPLLRPRLGHLRRYATLPALPAAPDVVVISHLHWDHLDLASLRLLGADTRLVVPRGAGALLHRAGFARVDEIGIGESLHLEGVRIEATPVAHSGFRPPFGPTVRAAGYLIEGSRRVYFAGDTALFPEMTALAAGDLALLPVGGWGPWLRGGHLDPDDAAEAARRIRPATALPVHWGTYWPAGVRRNARFALPGVRFAEAASRTAPAVDVRVPPPGARLTV
ncbi:MAG: MBL fold metallo-hydrolase [Dehalococcoidia bacterium]